MTETLGWKVHTPSLLKEILLNPDCQALYQPLNIFRDLLAKVAARATVLRDPELDALMMRLTLYSVADPDSPDYDAKVVSRYLGE